MGGGQRIDVRGVSNALCFSLLVHFIYGPLDPVNPYPEFLELYRWVSLRGFVLLVPHPSLIVVSRLACCSGHCLWPHWPIQETYTKGWAGESYCHVHVRSGNSVTHALHWHGLFSRSWLLHIPRCTGKKKLSCEPKNGSGQKFIRNVCFIVWL